MAHIRLQRIAMLQNVVSFTLSKDIHVPVRVELLTLNAPQRLAPLLERLADPAIPMTLSRVSPTLDLLATGRLYAGDTLLGAPVATSYVPFRSLRTWNQWLVFPVLFLQLPYNARLVVEFTEYVCGRPVVFGLCVVAVFDHQDGSVRRGKLRVEVAREAQGPQQLLPMAPANNEAERLGDLHDKYTQGDIPKNDWLDSIALPAVETGMRRQTAASETPSMLLRFVQFDLPVVYADTRYATPNLPRASSSVVGDELHTVAHPFFDPLMHRDDPIDQKFRKLKRLHQQGDRGLKPTSKERDQLNRILAAPPLAELPPADKDMVWRFRFHLAKDKRGLTKFLRSVSWQDPAETSQAVELMDRWVDVDVDAALEMLSPQFRNPRVRQHAVARLQRATDAEVMLCLLQLVQAIRYEIPDAYAVEGANGYAVGETDSVYEEWGEASNSGSSDETLLPLAHFLVHRAAANPQLATLFYWFVRVEAEDVASASPEVYRRVLVEFMRQPGELKKTVERQIELVERLVELCVAVKALSLLTPKKVEWVQQYLADPRHQLASFAPVLLPLDPTVVVDGCYPQEASVFKLSLSPIKLVFRTTDGKRYPLMFKVGDDLRQDQLVVQIITLMDRLLQEDNLDLKLTPYRILATGPVSGAIQFMANSTVEDILQEYSGVLGYLQHHNPDEAGVHGVSKVAMDTYVRLCAGYCVATYLLGVGDRHLDNLLISPDGHFFHADFGYILGADPKPFPPLMKLPIQLVDGMGGVESPQYAVFQDYCFTCFLILRRLSPLILNLFQLMAGANIPEIRVDPQGAVAKVRDKFMLDLKDEEAVSFFRGLIADSVSAFLPVVIDRLHSLAQYWRA